MAGPGLLRNSGEAKVPLPQLHTLFIVPLVLGAIAVFSLSSPQKHGILTLSCVCTYLFPLSPFLSALYPHPLMGELEMYIEFLLTNHLGSLESDLQIMFLASVSSITGLV